MSGSRKRERKASGTTDIISFFLFKLNKCLSRYPTVKCTFIIIGIVIIVATNILVVTTYLKVLRVLDT